MNPLLNPDHLTVSHGKNTFTATEIANQPDTWKKIWKKIQHEANRITSFLKNIRNESDLDIVLTGAGSSAFIGDAVSSSWLKSFKSTTQAIPTTDLLTHFEERIVITKPLLLISFARSGNSPESAAVVQKANMLCDTIYHLIITCNPNGKLAQLESRDNTYVFLLPPETEDKSLAMTNSFTSMALTGTLIPKLFSETDNIEVQIDTLASYGKKIIDQYASLCYKIARIDFNRIVFLGSGPLWGIAKESHLKVQELTNGQIIGKFDSFLGFRHGPKAIINNQTLLVYLLSNDKQTSRYEKDLLDQIAQHKINLTTVGISETTCTNMGLNFAIQVNDHPILEEIFWAILCTLPAQIIGFYKSLFLGYDPDHPSADGTISRVVEGVTIYDDLSKNGTPKTQ